MSNMTGLSPLTRGVHIQVVAAGLHPGFIPAYAGSTEYDSPGIPHPIGLSPLTRGVLIEAIQARVIDRFIPAYAGSTLTKPLKFKQL